MSNQFIFVVGGQINEFCPEGKRIIKKLFSEVRESYFFQNDYMFETIDSIDFEALRQTILDEFQVEDLDFTLSHNPAYPGSIYVDIIGEDEDDDAMNTPPFTPSDDLLYLLGLPSGHFRNDEQLWKRALIKQLESELE